MNFLNITKLAIYGIFFNYYCYYTMTGSFIPHGTMAFYAIAFLCIFFDIIALHGGKVYVGREIKCWIIYGILALATTMMFTSVSTSALYGDIFKYFQRIFLIMAIAYIAEEERTLSFPLHLMAVTAILTSVAVFSTLGDYARKLDITSGAELSTNDVGSIMAFGCIAILFGFGSRYKDSIVISLFKGGSIIACISVIFLTGSRKSIYAIIIFAVLFVLLCGSYYFRHLTPARFFMVCIVAGVIFYVVYHYLWQYADDTNLYMRTLGEKAEAAAGSNGTRIALYIKALQEFVHHPFVGIGYDNFRNLHDMYTHSTYAEPLACSGLIGLIYLAPYVGILLKQIGIIKLGMVGTYEDMFEKFILVYYIAFLFVGIGIPYIYKDVPCIILGMMVASQRITYENIYASEVGL